VSTLGANFGGCRFASHVSRPTAVKDKGTNSMTFSVLEMNADSQFSDVNQNLRESSPVDPVPKWDPWGPCWREDVKI
jgi:hypothetical protein